MSAFDGELADNRKLWDAWTAIHTALPGARSASSTASIRWGRSGWPAPA